MSSKSEWNKPEYAIPLTTILILILFGGLAALLYLRKPPATPSTCPVGECATNLYNGTKRCSTDGTPVSYTQGYEVCNPELACSNSQTLFTYYDPKIGTVPRGTCPLNIDPSECRCMNGAICPINITSYWQLVETTDNIGEQENLDIASYTQMTYWKDQNGVARGPPFNIGSAAISRNSCFINPDAIFQYRILPGCESTLVTKQCVSGQLVYYDMCSKDDSCTDFDRLAQGRFACVNDKEAIDIFTSLCKKGDWLQKTNGVYYCQEYLDINGYENTLIKC